MAARAALAETVVRAVSAVLAVNSSVQVATAVRAERVVAAATEPTARPDSLKQVQSPETGPTEVAAATVAMAV